MLKAVAFDMDDTLLSINLSAFIAVFAKDEATLLADVGRANPLSMLATFMGTMLNLNNNARAEDDLRTNRAYFDDEIERRSGIPLADPVIAEVLGYYEREVLPTRNDTIIAARPRKGALEALDTVLSRGLRVALLTNPCFSEACIRCRMGWGELDDVPFELVTHMENTFRVKPSADYYLDCADRLGLAPDEILMVGNDAKRDFPSPDCGIQTAYVGGRRRPVRATWAGSMEEFAAHFDEVEELFYEHEQRRLVDIVQDVSSARGRRDDR